MPILLISMFVPLISAYIVIRLKLHGRLRDFGLKSAKQRRYYLYALLYPFLILGIGLLLVVIFQTAPIVSSLEEFKRNLLTVPLSRLQPTTPVNELPAEALDIVFYLTLFSLPLAPFINAIPAFGEEYGWRGFLLDKLIARHGVTIGLVATGIIWGLWHAPLILMGYNYPSYPNAIGVIMFTVWTVMAGFFIGWLRIKSGSVYPAALAHGAINAYMGLGLIVAPSQNELFSIPMGVPALLSLTLVAIFVYADMRKTFRSTFM